MENVNYLIRATDITDRVFQEKGHGDHKVNVSSYLRTGNTDVFTSTNGARDMMNQVDLKALNQEIKIQVLNYGVGVLSTPEFVRSHQHTIAEYVIEFARGVKMGYGNCEEYDEYFPSMINDPKNKAYIVDILKEAYRLYPIYENKLAEGKITGGQAELIDILQETKEYQLKKNKKSAL